MFLPEVLASLLGARVTLGAPSLSSLEDARRELREIRDRLDRLEAWRIGLRSMLAVAAATYSGDLSRFADQLHDAMDDERAELRIPVPIDQRPTDRISRTALGGDRPGSEREDRTG